MITKTKFAAALAALALAATLAIPSNDAQARPRWGTGLAVGLIGGAIVGAAVASHAYAGPYYVDGRRCRFVRQYDAYGYYVGTERYCRY